MTPKEIKALLNSQQYVEVGSDVSSELLKQMKKQSLAKHCWNN